MKESAVTHVVGVMLLLSITIIAVAVVSVFVGGVVKTTDITPSAEIYVSASGSGDNFNIIFEHRGGDALSSKDIKVTTFIKNSETENSSYLSELYSEQWEAGSRITTGNKSMTAEFLGVEGSVLTTEIEKSTPLEIKMYHIPTSTIIYQSAILLEEK